VVDEVTDPSVARAKLAWWHAEVAQAFAGRPSHPVMRALMPGVPAYGLEQQQLQDVIRGCEMDLEQTRYFDFPGLQRYCHLVAGVVGEVAARIFGQSQPGTTAYAHRLGLAFQLTNIIRDVGEDAMRGRIYLPVSELQQFDVKAHEILSRKHSDRFVALMRFRRSARTRCTTRRSRCCRRRTALAEARADDGEHLPHAAARDRGRGLPRAEPAQQPDPAAQVLAGVEGAGAGPDVKLAVVGAGWAGLAAAVRAVQRGHHATVLEAARTLGGRARTLAVDLPAGGTAALDNGQHILVGAYVETLRLMEQVGVAPGQALLRLPLVLRHPDGTGLALPDWPAPWDVLAGILLARGWRWADRFSLVRAALAWRRAGFRCDPALTVAQLAAGVSPRVRQDVIEPLCVAALNTPAERASAEVFLRVVGDALFARGHGAWRGGDLLLPRQALGQLFPEHAHRWLAARGAQVRTGARARTLRRAGSAWQLDDEAFDAVVLACGASEAARLVRSAGVQAGEWLAEAEALRFEAIATVYVTGGPALPQPIVALRSGPEAPAQFVFDRGQLGGPPGLLAFVASASGREKEAVESEVLAQAGALGWSVRVLRTVVEKRATFACEPALRRPPGAIAPGLWACGDYVAGPYPATLEGAVRSGLAAAERLQEPGRQRNGPALGLQRVTG